MKPESRVGPCRQITFFDPAKQMDYADVIDRVVALPLALTWEPGWVLRSCSSHGELGKEEIICQAASGGFVCFTPAASWRESAARTVDLYC